MKLFNKAMNLANNLPLYNLNKDLFESNINKDIKKYGINDINNNKYNLL